MNEKYVMLNDKTCQYLGCTLHRIMALKDFGNVKAGDIGGWIEKESNLSDCDRCWVYDEARVYGNAKVIQNAKICNHAEVSICTIVRGNAIVCGNALVWDHAVVSTFAKVNDQAVVRGNAKVFGYAVIGGSADVSGNAAVGDNAMVYEYAKVYGDATICDRAVVFGYAEIYGTAYVGGKARVGGKIKAFGTARLAENGLYFGDEVYGEKTPIAGNCSDHEPLEKGHEDKIRPRTHISNGIFPIRHKETGDTYTAYSIVHNNIDDTLRFVVYSRELGWAYADANKFEPVESD